jgi:hypothetical protein
MTRQSDQQSEFERNARAAFDASVEGLDARTRSRLNQARQAATAELERRQRSRWVVWAPAGVLAAAALAAVLLTWRAPGPGSEPPQARAQAVAAEAVEVLAADDDLDLASEDLDFYQWVGDQAGATSNGIG